MKIHFLGAAKTVTGSNYLIEACGKRFLVDCGLYQGPSLISKENYSPFGFEPSSLDFIILTHAHIDHSGRIPLLFKQGYSNKIYCTRPTSALSSIMLKDSAMIHEEGAVVENLARKKAGLDSVEPLYSLGDAENAIQYLYPVDYDVDVSPAEGISFKFKDAGHLLGSAYVELKILHEGVLKTLTFSGDLGSGNSLLLDDCSKPHLADYVVMESTYGDSNHIGVGRRGERLADEAERTYKNGGIAIIPSFAVGRTQEIIYELYCYYENAGRLKDFLKIPIYVDSPLAFEATKIYSSYSSFMSEKIRSLIESGHNPLYSKNIKYITDHKESQALALNKDPKIIISSSGMCDGGRVKLHLSKNLPLYKSKVIIVGYQAEETLGRELLSEPSTVKIYGEEIALKAKIINIEGFSGHADVTGLTRWLLDINEDEKSSNIKKLFLCHGEMESIESLKGHINSEILESLDIYIPSPGEVVEL